MASREDILKALNKNKPEHMPLPDLKIAAEPMSDRISRFKELLESVGARCEVISGFKDVQDRIEEYYPDEKVIVSSNRDINTKTVEGSDPTSFSDVQLAVLKGDLGVAENGATWIGESEMVDRVVPFMLLLKKENVVDNMHQAYEKIEVLRPGFGIFIAGPSKTADIEQSLVIGAHGARSLTVLLY